MGTPLPARAPAITGLRSRAAPRASGAAVARLKAIADATRLTMLLLLAESREPLCVCEFQRALGVEQPTVSHHLRVLRETGLVVSERHGSWIYSHLAPETALWVRAVLAGLPR
jgi:DNA-binding transcriptional ArsR family regulator